VDSANPEPDINDTGEVRWNGPRDLSDDQPRLTVVRREDETPDGTDDSTDVDGENDGALSPPFYTYALVVLLILSAGAVVYHREVPEPETEPVEEDRTPDEEPVKEVLENVPDDKRILRIVQKDGGRMKQKKVVQETGWSEAKVSQVTSRLEDEGKIRKLRMGRENILEIQKEDEEKENGDDDPGL